MTGVEALVLMVVAIVAALVGAGVAAVGIRRADARAWRWLDQRAAERVISCWTRHGKQP